MAKTSGLEDHALFLGQSQGAEAETAFRIKHKLPTPQVLRNAGTVPPRKVATTREGALDNTNADLFDKDNTPGVLSETPEGSIGPSGNIYERAVDQRQAAADSGNILTLSQIGKNIIGKPDTANIQTQNLPTGSQQVGIPRELQGTIEGERLRQSQATSYRPPADPIKDLLESDINKSLSKFPDVSGPGANTSAPQGSAAREKARLEQAISGTPYRSALRTREDLQPNFLFTDQLDTTRRTTEPSVPRTGSIIREEPGIPNDGDTAGMQARLEGYNTASNPETREILRLQNRDYATQDHRPGQIQREPFPGEPEPVTPVGGKPRASDPTPTDNERTAGETQNADLPYMADGSVNMNELAKRQGFEGLGDAQERVGYFDTPGDERARNRIYYDNPDGPGLRPSNAVGQVPPELMQNRISGGRGTGENFTIRHRSPLAKYADAQGNFTQAGVDRATAGERGRISSLREKRLGGGTAPGYQNLGGGGVNTRMNEITARNAANGGDVRDINRQFDKAIRDVRGRGVHSERTRAFLEGDRANALNQYRSGQQDAANAGSGLDAGDILRDQRSAEGQQIQRDKIDSDEKYRNTVLDINAQMAGATSRREEQELFRKDYIPLLAYMPDGEGGFTLDPQLQARLEDLTSGITDTRVARNVAGMERAITGINNELRAAGVEIQDITELFDLDPKGGGLTFQAGTWSDMTNAKGYDWTDWLADILPGGSTGDVLRGSKIGADGEKREVRVSAGELQRMGLPPAVLQTLFGKASRGNR